MKAIKLGIFFSVIFWLASCSNPPTPKPKAYFQIDLPQADYTTVTDFNSFSFDASNQTLLKTIKDSADYQWFDIEYPELKAIIHCTYIPVNPKNFSEFEEKSKDFVYLHLRKADAFQEQRFENRKENVFGVLYEMKGNVISPTQIVLTDSIRSLFRGALYFEQIPQQDSIAPVLEYINKDIQQLIETFQWKTSSKK